MAAATTSVLSLYGSPALADSLAGGATNDSPGVLSGNTVQAPIDVPVNACGNTVDVIALLNPAFGNSCDGHSNAVRQSSPNVPRQTGSRDTGSHNTGSRDTGSHNTGSHNTGSGRTPGRQGQTPPPTGVGRTPPVGRAPAPRLPAPADRQRSDVPTSQVWHSGASHPRLYDASVRPGGAAHTPTLAETGSEATLAASGVSAVLIAGGMILYRRGRAAYRR